MDHPDLDAARAQARYYAREMAAESVKEGRLNLRRRDAKVRLAHLMCEMACRYGAAPARGRVRFELQMTQVQLADATGLTPVHVNRKLKSLRDDGLVMRHRTVRIDDWERFAAVDEFDEGYLQTDREPEERLRIVN